LSSSIIAQQVRQQAFAARTRPIPDIARKFSKIKSRQNFRLYGIFPGMRDKGGVAAKRRRRGSNASMEDGKWKLQVILQNEPKMEEL
jgi:hypothetical protein